MKEALTLVDSQAKVQNIEIRTHFPPEPCQILGVPSLLEQVFINLLLNAMNAMPNGGTVDVFAEQSVGEVLLRVTDSGEGISPEDLDKIFDPFFTRAPLGKGTGLGLSICHSIVDQHGGSVSAESQSGKGSTFTVKLPSLFRKERGNRGGHKLLIQWAAKGSAGPEAAVCEQSAVSIAAIIAVCKNGFSTNPQISPWARASWMTGSSL